MAHAETSDLDSARFAEDEKRWRDWMTRAQEGDREAYRRLLEELSEALHAFLQSRLQAASLVDDCVQECLLGVHRARHSYDPRHPFRPWLFAIARHKTVDALRRSGVRIRREVSEPEAAAAASHSPAEARDRALDAHRALANLEPPFREALVLTKIEGHSIQEAARRAGISATAMKTRVRRGLRKIRGLLEEDGA